MRIDGKKLLRVVKAKFGTQAAFRRQLVTHEDCETLSEGNVRAWFRSATIPSVPHMIGILEETGLTLDELMVRGQQVKKRARGGK